MYFHLFMKSYRIRVGLQRQNRVEGTFQHRGHSPDKDHIGCGREGNGKRIKKRRENK